MPGAGGGRQGVVVEPCGDQDFGPESLTRSPIISADSEDMGVGVGGSQCAMEAPLLEPGTRFPWRPGPARARPPWGCQLRSPGGPSQPGGEPLPHPRSPRRRTHSRPTPQSSMLLPKLSSQPAAQLKEDAGSARDPAVPAAAARPELEGARLLPALRDRQGRGAGAQRAGGLGSAAPPPAAGALPGPGTATRPPRSPRGPPAPPPRSAHPSSPLALGRLSRSRLLLRAVPANFPSPAGAPRSRQAGHCRPRAAGSLRPGSRPRAPGALRRDQRHARGRGPRRSPGEMAGRWDFG